MRAVLAASTAESGEAMRATFREAGGFEIVAVVTNGEDALSAAALGPDVVVADVNLPGLTGLQLAERAAADMPSVAIVLVTSQESWPVYRRALRSGAVELLAAPLGPDDVDAVRRAVLAFQRRVDAIRHLGVGGGQLRGRIVAVCAPKDGVGKTTLALSLAATLSERGGDVILADLDLQFGDLSAYVRGGDGAGVPTLADLTQLILARELRRDSVEAVLQRRGALRVLLSPADPAEADDLSVCLSSACPLVNHVVPAADAAVKKPVTGPAIRTLIDFLRSTYALTVLDTGASINDVTLSAVAASDVALVVTLPVATYVRNTLKLIAACRRMGKTPEVLPVVVNRVGGRDEVLTVGDIASQLADHAVLTVPDDRRVPLDLLEGHFRSRRGAFRSALDRVADALAG